MSMPNIPNISPEINLKTSDVINLLLASIALEEIGLSHIINAEGEKIQAVLADCPKANKLDHLLEINKSVEKTLRDIIKKEILLEFKFENVLELIDKTNHKKHEED